MKRGSRGIFVYTLASACDQFRGCDCPYSPPCATAPPEVSRTVINCQPVEPAKGVRATQMILHLEEPSLKNRVSNRRRAG